MVARPGLRPTSGIPTLLWQLVLMALGVPSMAMFRPVVSLECGRINVMQFVGRVTVMLAGISVCLKGPSAILMAATRLVLVLFVRVQRSRVGRLGLRSPIKILADLGLPQALLNVTRWCIFYILVGYFCLRR